MKKGKGKKKKRPAPAESCGYRAASAPSCCCRRRGGEAHGVQPRRAGGRRLHEPPPSSCASVGGPARQAGRTDAASVKQREHRRTCLSHVVTRSSDTTGKPRNLVGKCSDRFTDRDAVRDTSIQEEGQNPNYAILQNILCSILSSTPTGSQFITC